MGRLNETIRQWRAFRRERQLRRERAAHNAVLMVCGGTIRKI